MAPKLQGIKACVFGAHGTLFDGSDAVFLSPRE